MRKLLLPLTAAATTAAAGAAVADTSTGVIQSINTARPSVTLADGMLYVFPKSDATDTLLMDFKAGDKVQITWALNGTEHDAMQMSPLN